MPPLLCPRLERGFTWNFETELERLRGPGAFSLHQPSLSPVATPFYGASAALCHDGKRLYVAAELKDVDIYNTAVRMNEKTWMTGDVFEMFLKPEPQIPYYEFHVTPENQILQLRLPSSEAFYCRKGTLEERQAAFANNLQGDVILESLTEIDRENGCWRVLAALPLDRVCEEQKWRDQDVWLASFCRYDYTHGVEKPVLSSSSPMDKADFHNQAFWRRLVFNSGDSLS